MELNLPSSSAPRGHILQWVLLNCILILFVLKSTLNEKWCTILFNVYNNNTLLLSKWKNNTVLHFYIFLQGNCVVLSFHCHYCAQLSTAPSCGDPFCLIANCCLFFCRPCLYFRRYLLIDQTQNRNRVSALLAQLHVAPVPSNILH